MSSAPGTMHDQPAPENRRRLELALAQAARELLDAQGVGRLVIALDEHRWVAIEPCPAPREPSTAPSPSSEAQDLPKTMRSLDDVDVHDERTLKHWMERLDVTREDLVAAVGKVGGAATELCAYFVQHRKHW